MPVDPDTVDQTAPTIDPNPAEPGAAQPSTVDPAGPPSHIDASGSRWLTTEATLKENPPIA